MPRILIIHGNLLTFNNVKPYVEDGFVYIEDDVIVDYGGMDDLREEYRRADLVLNSNKRIVMPCLISAHTHLALYPVRFMASNYSSLDEWIEGVALRYERELREEVSRSAAVLALAELMEHGVGGVVDMHFNMDAIAGVLLNTGLYANLSVAIMGGGPYSSEDDALKDNLRLYENWNGAGGGRITVSLGPCTIRYVSKRLLEEVASLSREKEVGVHMHLSEVKEDVDYCKKNYGKRPVELLEELGLLSERSVFAHAVWLSLREIKLLAKHGSTVVHCPSINSLLFDGVAPLPELKRGGVGFGIGVDCAPKYSVLDEIYSSTIVYRVTYGPPQRISSRELLEYSIKYGCKALLLNQPLGAIDKGFKASLTILDLKPPARITLDEICDLIVYTRPKAETLIVDGEILVDGGENLVIGDREIRDANKVVREYLNQVFGNKSIA